jgi:hypothetical protein
MLRRLARCDEGGPGLSQRRWLLGSCTLTVATPTAIPMAGTATFSSSSEGGAFNRLQLALNTPSLDAVQFSGCGLFSGVLELILPLLTSSLEATVTSVLFGQQLCGAAGPEVFGPREPVGSLARVTDR